MRKSILAAAVAALTLTTTAVTIETADARPHDRRYHRTNDGVRYWRGDNGRYYCKRNNGTTGLLVGGVAGALVGRSIDTRGDRAAGTLLGAAGGALLGREIDRGGSRSRCR
ncbi:hypothetical protein WSK_0497 [Novosphingobium sp. Rr 2-17]|uniref:glycine zipper 2TM domain-containing protein n=1 Tax=Novosphingobium sp. Rr 2-17 TaxID=555793 RepID=UPI0002699E5C|nr:glycine zipper 2TM domain-containing protein [Novosphingobium sp. Rr 2-17]EIZ80815.1 hypothetical protein WSK_0497 [Novosphingobium sp. Rr 2-17]